MISHERTISKNSNKRNLPWIEKYRPNQIDDIISHQEIIQSLKKFIQKETFPHLLLFGPSGSGKTTTIKCCANAIYGQYRDCMTLQLNASNERGIETVRTKIKNFVGNKTSIFLPSDIKNIFKLVILDEIDSMTVEAQGVLRQTIEKNSATTRFCLICNDIDKINIALQSRCALYRFPPLNEDCMISKLKEICELEKIEYKKGSIESIVKISKGDMRIAINILQNVSSTVKYKIKSKHVYKMTGYCMPKINANIFNKLMKLSKKKMDLTECVKDLVEIVILNNITIFNLLEELKNIVIESKLLTNQKIYLIDNFAFNEMYDSVNVDPKNIIMIVTSLFVNLSDVK